jgi:hypothetical protein
LTVAGGRGGWWAGLDGRNRRALVVAAVFVAVLIAFLGVKLVGGGGGGAPAAGPVSPVTTLAPGIPGGLPATTSTTAGGTTASTGQVFSSKDPFQPPRGFVTATTATGGTGSSGGPGTTATTTTVASGSAGAGTAGGTTDGSTAPSGRQQVELLDVYATGGTDYASVRVNDTVYRASPGQTFDTDYRVVDLALSSGCGDFSFQSKGFHLCKGQQVVE